MNNKINEYWNNFLIQANKDPNTKYFEAFYFGSNEQSANNLFELVLSGKKTATASSLVEYLLSDSPLPQVGDYSVVTDWEGNPRCIIKTQNVLQIKFEDMTYDICKREGEDDTLESWQKNHIDFFTTIGPKIGFEFSWDMEIIFEDFKVVYQ